MRTFIIILSGLALLGFGVALARRFGKPGGSAVSDTVLAFTVSWLLATATNLWVGVAKAGYTLREELPIALLIFAVPAAAALLVMRRLR